MTIKIKDFHVPVINKAQHKIICIEDASEDGLDFKRSFIIFDDLDYDYEQALNYLKNVKQKIHQFMPDMNKVEVLCEGAFKNLTDSDARWSPIMVAHTHRYWKDVRIQTSGAHSNHFEEAVRFGHIQQALYSFIDNQYYTKDKFVDFCNEGQLKSAIAILQSNLLDIDELQSSLKNNPEAQKIFDTYQLNHNLDEELPHSPQKHKKNKI